MGFKPKEKREKIWESPEVEFSPSQFVEDVFNDEYILVVGSEVIMNTEEEPSGDVNQYILRAINSTINSNEQYKDFNELYRETAAGIDPIRNLLNYDEDFTYDINDMSPELCDLLKTRLFRFVLTTTFDGYLETLMRTIWGDKLRVVNVRDKATADELRKILASCRGSHTYTAPTLIYIFGKAVKDESKPFVRTDDDAILAIDQWMQMSKELDPLLRFISNKKLLALGCKFEDWYFRFFWYILKRDINRFREGQVAFLLDEQDVLEQKLMSFLKHSKIFRHHGARAFMTDITTMLTSTSPENPFCSLISNNRKHGGVFISYSSKDFYIASRLFFMLCKQGFNVWFDNSNLHGGDDYNREIDVAIEKSQVFLTVLSPSVAEDLINNRTENYYNKEWRKANQFEDKHIIPVAVNDYDLRAAYHTNGYETIVGKSITGINLMDTSGFTNLVDSIKSNLDY